MAIVEVLRKLRRASAHAARRLKPYALLTGCMALSILVADQAINRYVAQKRNSEFNDDIIQLGLSIKDDLISGDYIQLDEALLGFLRIKRSVHCLTVFNSNNQILSAAQRSQIETNPTIVYGYAPQPCRLPSAGIKPTTNRWQFKALSSVQNNGIPIGTLIGFAKTDRDSLATIRSIEATLLIALCGVFIPAFVLLRSSGKREVRMEKERAERIAGLMNKLEDAEQRTRSAFEGTNDGWWQWQIHEDQAKLSEKILKLLEIDDVHGSSEVVPIRTGNWWTAYTAPGDQKSFRQFLIETRNQIRDTPNQDIKETELRATSKRSKRELYLRVTAVVTEFQNGTPSVVALVVNDITTEKEQKKNIHQLAFYDQLTGLHNRSSLELEIERRWIANDIQQRLVLFALDLDKFKFINDSYGHSVGDQLLIQVANRLRDELKPDNFIARLGGDEFVVVMRIDTERDDIIQSKAESLAHRLLKVLSQPYRLERCVANNTCSIGISIEKTPDDSKQRLMDKADLALYQAKANGRNRYFFYQDGMAQIISKRAATAGLLQSHLQHSLTSLKLEPIVSLIGSKSSSSGTTIRGYEALFRCPGIKKPVPYLIQCAEESGIIRMVTESILENVSKHTRSNPDQTKTYVSINISPLEFLEVNFPRRFLSTLEHYQLKPEQIKIEITESTLLQDISTTRKNMCHLNSVGIEFYLDDFGTGYSSIKLLRGLPFHCLKIDRTYISNLHHASGLKLVKAIIDLAKAFNLTLVGEGVETPAQMNALQSLGCDYAQGYLFKDNTKFINPAS